jgi:CD109 antigen
LETYIVLKGSDDYKFIHVEEYGYVVSYAPRLSEGDHHHLVWVKGQSEREVHIPVAPQKEQGEITVRILLSTQIMSSEHEVKVNILPEGSIVHRHTSVLLDLKSRANVYNFMNIIVDETPIIPYEVYRRYVAGSPYAHITVCGDVIGPAFPGNKPVNLERMFPTGHGRHGKGTEYHAFNLAANTWQLHYFRLTNQLPQHWSLAKRVFEQMNVEYTAVMRRFSSQGWVSNWDNSNANVWLTAWVIRIFQSVSFQDWEDYIYIDPAVIGTAVMWLLNYQTLEGSFTETEWYPFPLHKPMDGRSLFPDDEPGKMRNVSLTAHVLISLEVTAPNLQGDQKKFSAAARQRAVRYLERMLAKIEDSYELAITAYALAIAGSSVSDLAYGKLTEKQREEGGMVYWGRSPIETNSVRYEFNRPFLEAKAYQDDDALAVEATGYALLTMFMVEGGGNTIILDKVVQWMNTMRLGDGGFISTVDTIVAMEALVRYSYNSRIKDITDLSVEVDAPDSNMTKIFHIKGEENIAKLQRIDIPNVWGHINLVAHGAGQAIAQLDVNWGVDYEPFKDHPASDCFNLTVQEFFHGRNKSEITIRSCFSWTLTTESPVSGMAILEVDIPSGYIILQPEANQIVRSRVVPEMRDADVLKPGKTIWYFDYIPPVTRCFEHTVRRYYPVANLTRTRQAVIVEPLRPERFFVRTFNATSLYILSICEVCGSYQCPYCPFYSSAPALPASHWLQLVAVALSILTVRAALSKGDSLSALNNRQPY